MTADEMFEELGYKKYDNHPEQDEPPKEEDMLVTQDCRVIVYTAQDIIKGHYCLQRISFQILDKKIICEANIDRKVATAVPFCVDEIKAINLKCKELGWIE